MEVSWYPVCRYSTVHLHRPKEAGAGIYENAVNWLKVAVSTEPRLTFGCVSLFLDSSALKLNPGQARFAAF